jgi:hypothetical protein
MSAMFTKPLRLGTSNQGRPVSDFMRTRLTDFRRYENGIHLSLGGRGDDGLELECEKE